MWVWWLVATAQATCDPVALVDQLEKAVLDARFDDAEAISKQMVEAFGCSPRADQAVLARLWNAESVMLDGFGESSAADDALRAAFRTSPTTWNPAFGEGRRTRQQALGNAGAPGLVRIEPLTPGTFAAIDGEMVQLPATVAPGLHLVQIGREPNAIYDARIIDLPAASDVVLTFDPPPGFASGEGAPVRSRRRNRITHALVIGALGAAAYGITVPLSGWVEQDVGARRTAGIVNNGLVVGAVGLGATSAVLLGRGLATPRTL